MAQFRIRGAIAGSPPATVGRYAAASNAHTDANSHAAPDATTSDSYDPSMS
jgi:hypothetical protein